MRFRLWRDESRLGDVLVELAGQLSAASHQLAAAMDADPIARAGVAARLQATDQAAEAAAHEVMRGLAATFVTPFDRADLFRLTWSMRRWVARVDAVGDTLEVLGVGELPIRTSELVQLVVRCAEIVAGVVPRLGDPGRLAGEWIELTVLIKQAGQVHRRLLHDVTATVSDPSLLARQFAVALALNRVVDAVEAVTDALQTVIVTES